MSKALIKISKIIPRFHNASDSDKLMCLTAIEKLLASESITWVDAGIKLGEALTVLLAIPDEELLSPPKPASPEPSQGWTAAPRPTPQPQPAPQAAPQAQAWQTSTPPPRPHYNPTPPPKRPDPRIYGSPQDRLACVADILSKLRPTLSAKDIKMLQTIQFMLQTNMPITGPQEKRFAELSKQL